jgi:hypothetical protein
MKASLVAYDFRKLQKKLELKIIKYGYVRGCPKCQRPKSRRSKFHGLTWRKMNDICQHWKWELIRFVRVPSGLCLAISWDSTDRTQCCRNEQLATITTT